MINKNLTVLLLAQIFSFTAAPITVFLSGIIGSTMIENKSLATLPAALMIVCTATGSIFASYIMSVKGRKFGFMFATIVTSLFSLIASYSIYENIFLIYCLSNLFICFLFFMRLNIVFKSDLRTIVKLGLKFLSIYELIF